MSHDVLWTQPPALLNSAAARLLPTRRDAFQKPAILRFTSDAFMEEVLTLLDTAPERLRDYRVRRETWRGFVAAPEVEARKAPSLVLQRLGIVRRRVQMASGSSTAVVDATPPGTPLKLYQPANQRHYLVACSLVCNTPGLPDRQVEPGKGETIGCVIRRLLPPASRSDAAVETWDEYAWVAAPHGYVWQRVGIEPRLVLDGEERLPLFNLHFAENVKRKRRLCAGVIPVGRRDAYLGAAKASATSSGRVSTAGVTSRTSRKILLRRDVIEPWKSLIRHAQQVRASFSPPAIGDQRAPTLKERRARLTLDRAQIQTASWFILLDLAKYLATYLKPVWRAVLNPARVTGLSGSELDAFNALTQTTITTALRETLRHDDETSQGGNAIYALDDVPATLRAALARYGDGSEGLNTTLEQRLDGIDEDYDRESAASRNRWPGFLFALADPDLPTDAPLPAVGAVGSLTAEEQSDLALDDDPVFNDPLERVDKLAVLLLRALQDDEPVPEPAVPIAAIQPANLFEGWFVIRCVYERPGCEPVHGQVVSEATEPFQMAGFFDPDAPARPLRIGLPLDTTPGGLRKFDKNTAFVISDVLCGQMKRFRSLTLGDLVLSVLPWPFHQDLPTGSGGPCKAGNLSLGMICSLSIPIITICAFILLTIMVSLLDFVFRWLPYFVICFPVPGLKAKGAGSST